MVLKGLRHNPLTKWTGKKEGSCPTRWEYIRKICPTPLHERCSDGSTALWAQVLTEFGPSWFIFDYFDFIFGGWGVLGYIILLENVCIVVCIGGEGPVFYL